MGTRMFLRRRILLGGLATGCLGLLSGCGAASPSPLSPSQPRAAGTRRIGVLSGAPAEGIDILLHAFQKGLGEIGYVEGRDISIEYRFADRRPERLPELAAELVRLPVEIILTDGREAIRAAMQATSTIPIVFGSAGDPVGEGLVASLARPGGNVTGLANVVGLEQHAKRLQLLQETVPNLKRLAILGFRPPPREFHDVVGMALAQGLEVVVVEYVTGTESVDAVFGPAIARRADALFVSVDGRLSPHAASVVAFAEQHRLPAIYPAENYALAGGLLTYGSPISENWRRAATYVDKILKGARPGDLPVERPTKFTFVVNLKAAQAIGLNIPDGVLAQVTELVQ